MRAAVLALIAALLAVSNLYTYLYFTALNSQLRSELQQLAFQRSRELTEYSAISKMYMPALEASYSSVAEANGRLRKVLNSLRMDLERIPYNYTMMPYVEFAEKYTFTYTDEMREFVLNVTGGWDGTDEDFRSDLYKICRAWRSIFTYVSTAEDPPAGGILLISIGIFDFGWIEVYSLEGERWVRIDYLREVPLGYEIKPITVGGAPEIFRSRQGKCRDYAVALISLYNAYYDASGRSLPTIYLSVGGRDLHHAVVLIKLEGDRVAIVDWDVVTPVTGGMLEFVPFQEAKRLHEEYWGRSLSYEGYMRSRPYKAGRFNSTEEFYEWLVNELR
jgi:hypothetical protein